jgi:fimbrial chaperone protein
MSNLRWAFMSFLLAFGLAGVAHAMRVSPMVAELTTAGANSSARIEVQNVGTGPLAFETRITRIEYDENGQIKEVPADDDFLVFPPQGVLAPDARQVVRVQWLGQPDLPASQSYYLSVNQLPVDLTGEPGVQTGAQVQIVYHMKALITVAPPNASPKVEVVSAEAGLIQPPPAADAAADAPLPPKVPGMTIHFRNTGTRYAMLAGSTWLIDGKGKDGKPLRLTLTRDDLAALIGVGYIAPLRGDKTFALPAGQAFAEGPLKVSFGP